MTFREIREKIRNGEITTLFYRPAPEVPIHPSDQAKLLESLEEEEVLPAFKALGARQIEVFPYLSFPLQKEIIDQLSRPRVSYILNRLSSDDRTALFASFEEHDLPEYLELLSEQNKDATRDL